MIRAAGSIVVITIASAALLAAEPDMSFHDPLRKEIDKHWAWLREDEAAHRITDEGLEIRIQPGDANTVKNALLRPAPDRSKARYAVEVTVTSLAPPTGQWEQAGITWYVDGKPVFKLVKEHVDGKTVIVPGFATDPGESVRLRIIVSADSFTAQYKPLGKDAAADWKTAATGKLPPPNNDQISLQCYHGPENARHWVRFSDFAIVAVAEKAEK